MIPPELSPAVRKDLQSTLDDAFPQSLHNDIDLILSVLFDRMDMWIKSGTRDLVTFMYQEEYIIPVIIEFIRRVWRDINERQGTTFARCTRSMFKRTIKDESADPFWIIRAIRNSGMKPAYDEFRVALKSL